MPFVINSFSAVYFQEKKIILIKHNALSDVCLCSIERTLDKLVPDR